MKKTYNKKIIKPLKNKRSYNKGVKIVLNEQKCSNKEKEPKKDSKKNKNEKLS